MVLSLETESKLRQIMQDLDCRDTALLRMVTLTMAFDVALLHGRISRHSQTTRQAVVSELDSCELVSKTQKQ
jgi:hypothetical protein